MSESNRPSRGSDGFERWTDRQVREAIDRGAFDNLAGAGKPLADLDQPHDDLRWLRRKLREEEVAVLPPSLQLRQEVQALLARARAAPSDRQVRDLVEQANARIRRANRLGVAGPPHNLSPYVVDDVVERWREARPLPTPDPEPPEPPLLSETPAVGGRRRAPWRRRRP